MKKLAIFLITLFIIPLTTSITFADCRGCCSRHGGVVCVDGITKCRDGTPLSPKCQAKSCDKCDSTIRSPSRTPTPIPTQKYQETPQSAPISNTNSSPSDFRCNGHVAYGIPGPEDQLLCREGYAVGYDYDRKVPSWVAYRLTPDSVNKRFERSNKFKEDLEILEIIHIRFNLSELIQYQPVSALD